MRCRVLFSMLMPAEHYVNDVLYLGMTRVGLSRSFNGFSTEKLNQNTFLHIEVLNISDLLEFIFNQFGTRR